MNKDMNIVASVTNLQPKKNILKSNIFHVSLTLFFADTYKLENVCISSLHK